MADTAAFLHKNELYRSIDVSTLSWSFRFHIISQELLDLNADILCLQEIDHYQDFETFLNKYNYVGVFKQRTGENKDGCAVFWRVNKFELINCKMIEFKKNEFMDRDNVAIVVKLAVVGDKSKEIVVGNTHILFNPARGDIKLGQLKCFVEETEEMAKGNIPVLLCGGKIKNGGKIKCRF